MKSLGVSLVRSPPSLQTSLFQAQTFFHKWGRKQGLASAPESTAEGIGRWRRHAKRLPAIGHDENASIWNALKCLYTILGHDSLEIRKF